MYPKLDIGMNAVPPEPNFTHVTGMCSCDYWQRRDRDKATGQLPRLASDTVMAVQSWLSASAS